MLTEEGLRKFYIKRGFNFGKISIVDDAYFVEISDWKKATEIYSTLEAAGETVVVFLPLKMSFLKRIKRAFRKWLRGVLEGCLRRL